MRKLRLPTPREMAALAAFAALTAGCFACTSPALAASYTQTFEGDSAANYSPLKGKNSEGSKLDISTEKAHEGKESLKLAYKSSGYIEFTINQVQKFDFVGDKLYVAFWVYGNGRRDFASGAIRILDANNESMQFDLPGFAEAMAGEGWREVRTTIDLTKIGAHWGDNSDGKLDRPFGYLGLAATRNAETEASGTVYIDNLRLSDTPIGADTPAGAAPVAAPNPVANNAGAAPTGVPVAGANVTIAPVFSPATGPASEFLKWVTAPGSPVVFNSSITLPVGAQGYTVSWKVHDAFNNIVAEGKEPIAAGELQKNLTFRVAKPPKGVLYASALLMNAREEVIGEAKTRAAVYTPHAKAVPIDPFVWGVAAHVGREGGKNAPNEIALMRLLGFAASRSDMTWENIEQQQGKWTWDAQDKIYDTFEREGIMPMPLFGYGTKWASTGDLNSPDWKQWFFAPPRAEPFANYAAEAVKRYGHLTRYWEIWNEPDIDFWLGSVEQYAALVDATVPAVKKVQPQALIMNGGFSETKRRPTFIPDYLKLVKNRPDIYAIHTHGPFENLLRAETTVNNDLEAAGLTGAKRPRVFLNEAGYSNVKGTPESEQAIQLVKKMTYAPAAGFGAYVWYDLRDDGTDPDENEHNFGLVKNDYAPKASSIAAGVLLDTVGSRKFSQRLKLDNNGYGLIYQGSGQTVLTAWRQSQSKGDAILPLVIRAKAPAGTTTKLERRDIFGNSTPIPSQDGLFLLSLGNVPQYIVASGDKVQFELAGTNGTLLDYAPSVVIQPGESLPWQVKVANPFSTPFKGRLTVDGGAPMVVDVPAKTTRPYNVVLKQSGDAGSRKMIGLQLDSDQLPAPLKGTAELQTAVVVPSAPQSLSVTLPRSGIVSLFEATPMLDLHFKDAADLSATVAMQKTAEGIKVRVTATDQTHFTVPTNNSWWQGDSIQYAIGLPNGQLYEWMGALLPDGPKMILSLAPDGKTGAAAPVDIRRDGNNTIYEWTLPRTLPNGAALPERFSFDFIVNDNDGAGRKGWIEWTPGIGIEKNATQYVPIAVGK